MRFGIRISLVIVAGLAIFFVFNNTPLPKQENLYSYITTPQIYEAAYKKAPKVNLKTEDVKGLIINHHLYGGEFMAEIMQYAKTDDMKTVILIAPNHFNEGKGEIQVGNLNFKTPFGDVPTNTRLASKIGEFSNESFKKEHGITAVVPFIKKEIPNAKIIPIIIKDSLDPAEAEMFAKKLANLLPKNSLIVASLDFSHYVPLNNARFQDQMAVRVLNNLDLETANKINIDSVPTIQVLMHLMDIQGYSRFNLVSNSSSSIMQNNFNTLENTSYITGYFTKGQNKFEQSTNILISNIDYSSTPELKRFLMGNDFLFINSDLEFPNIYKKFEARRIAQFNSNKFEINSYCGSDMTKLYITITNESEFNQINLVQNCLKIDLENSPDFDIGITLNSTEKSELYIMPLLPEFVLTDMLKSNLEFNQEVAQFNF